ncbi:MAG TPA: hypothetical protein VF376_06040 [Thermoanaerobaculia bacterium]
MSASISEACTTECGVRVAGELDLHSREFFHYFTLPRGAEELLKPPKTEVEKVRLVTFGPGARVWSVDCPVCRKAITIMTRNP